MGKSVFICVLYAVCRLMGKRKTEAAKANEKRRKAKRRKDVEAVGRLKDGKCSCGLTSADCASRVSTCTHTSPRYVCPTTFPTAHQYGNPSLPLFKKCFRHRTINAIKSVKAKENLKKRQKLSIASRSHAKESARQAKRKKNKFGNVETGSVKHLLSSNALKVLREYHPEFVTMMANPDSAWCVLDLEAMSSRKIPVFKTTLNVGCCDRTGAVIFNENFNPLQPDQTYDQWLDSLRTEGTTPALTGIGLKCIANVMGQTVTRADDATSFCNRQNSIDSKAHELIAKLNQYSFFLHFSGSEPNFIRELYAAVGQTPKLKGVDMCRIMQRLIPVNKSKPLDRQIGYSQAYLYRDVLNDADYLQSHRGLQDSMDLLELARGLWKLVTVEPGGMKTEEEHDEESDHQHEEVKAGEEQEESADDQVSDSVVEDSDNDEGYRQHEEVKSHCEQNHLSKAN